MTISVRILVDSLAPSGRRLTTFECIYPRFIHAQLLTHRMLSRNVASSRAIPVSKMIESVKTNPAEPIFWGKNEPGMQAHEELDEDIRDAVSREWHQAMLNAVASAQKMADLGAHKQIVNRVLEPWAHSTTIVSGTDWKNFWFVRGDDEDPQPEMQVLARLMKQCFDLSHPVELQNREWHMPLILEQDREDALTLVGKMTRKEKKELSWPLSLNPNYTSVSSDREDIMHVLRQVSVGRCARVSYLTHDKTRDLHKDMELYNRLLKGLRTKRPIHASAFEHVAMALSSSDRLGNFIGWCQFRKLIPGEAGPAE